MTQDFAQKLAKDAVDGLLKQASKPAAAEVEGDDIKIDDETKKKLIEREIKMAADPDFELADLAKRSAADRMRRSLNRPAQTTPEKPEPPRDKAEFNVEIGRTAKTMLEMGIPWQAVAQYLIGSSTPQFPVAFGGTNQGLTLTDVLALVDRMNQNKPNSELLEILKLMREEIRTIKSTPPPVPLDPLAQIEQTVETVKRLKGIGIFPEPPPPTVEGEPLEVVKEKNRHAEKMEEIKTERDYKEKLVGVVEEIPVSLGKGWAAETASRSRQGGPSPSSSPDKESGSSFQCHNPNCKATIFVPPDIPPRIKCPNPECGMIYQAGQAPAPAPSPTPSPAQE